MKCNPYEYASVLAVNLRRHLKTDSGEKSFTCNQCDFAYAHSEDLRKHLKTHTGEKSLKCNQCDYASVLAGNLRRHLKTHIAKPHWLHLWIIFNRFKDTFDNTQRGKAKQMQRMQLCILSNRPFKETYENTKKCNQCYYASSRV